MAYRVSGIPRKLTVPIATTVCNAAPRHVGTWLIRIIPPLVFNPGSRVDFMPLPLYLPSQLQTRPDDGPRCAPQPFRTIRRGQKIFVLHGIDPRFLPLVAQTSPRLVHRANAALCRSCTLCVSHSARHSGSHRHCLLGISATAQLIRIFHCHGPSGCIVTGMTALPP